MSSINAMDYESDISSPAGIYDDKENDFLKSVIDVSEDLENFEHRVLRGEIKKMHKTTGEEYWEKIPGSDQIMNELGVRELMSRVIGRVTKSAKLSYKEDEELYKDIMYFDFSISELVAKRSDSWGMNEELAKSIKDSAIELVWDILCSSRNGFTAINIKSTYNKSDVTRTDSQQTGGNRRTFLGIGIPGTRK
jgi:hypothetical protein